MDLRTIKATRYVTPLREGGSLPAIVEADDDGLYVLKFRGAGQGPKALIAELIAGEIGRALNLPIPEIVFVELDPELARTEPDPEIQDLIKASTGLNLALDYLPGSITFDSIVTQPDAELASSIVWFDALVSNIDRTPRNPNILTWHKKLWLIDHGAALYFHHASWDFVGQSKRPFSKINEHVLLRFATRIAEEDERLAALLTTDKIREIVELIPDTWIENKSGQERESIRNSYFEYLVSRLSTPREFYQETLVVK